MKLTTLFVSIALLGALLLPACGGSDPFGPPPSAWVQSVSPTSGSAAGGTLVTVSGQYFDAVTKVFFGGIEATDVTIVNSTTITCRTPSSGAVGAVEVKAEHDNGAVPLPDGFTYTQVTLYAADGKSGGAGNLWGINPATGDANVIGPIGFGITGLVVGNDGFLYGTQSSEGNSSSLIRIDPATGAGTAVGLLQTAGAADDHFSIAGLTLLGGQLFGWSENGDEPVWINATTGEVTEIGGGSGSSGSGIAANAGGTTYIAINGSNGTLDTVDSTTGAVTTGPTITGISGSTSAICAMTFLNGTLYALAIADNGSASSASALYTIDPTTGAATLVKDYAATGGEGASWDSIAGRSP